jgi:thiamine-phosphate pyrophosphorylase
MADESGLNYFMLREKELTDAALLEVAQHLRPNIISAKFIVNGSLAVATAVSADGIHLQNGNIPIHKVREKYANLLIGYSAHSLEEMQAAAAEGADYLTISPVFSPRSKQSSLNPIGVEVLSSWRGQVKIPVFALGGITVENLAELLKAGCAGAAGISLFVDDHGHFTSKAMQFV